MRFLHAACLRIAGSLAIAIAVLAAPAAWAATLAVPPPTNLSDHWWIPAESGWGLYLTQHDERVLFGLLFVYSETGRAQWFVMPEMKRGEGAAPVYSGALYSTNGSPIGTTFNPASTLVQQRGQATITPLLDGRAQLRYSVDGTTIEKTIQRMDVVALPIDGAYSVRLAASETTSCNGQTAPDREIWRITRTATGYEFSRARYGENPSTPRPLQYTQHGNAATASFAEPSSPARGSWTLVLDSLTGYALNGTFAFIEDSPIGGCTMRGSFSATRDFPLISEPGYLGDQYWDPVESGWGLSVSHGSFGLFAILFVYSSEARDAQGRGLAQWYVMPEMSPLPIPEPVPDPPPPPSGYRGTIYATQGTPFTQPFNAAGVTLTSIGDATLSTISGTTATLTYRIGAQSVTKVLRRFETAPLPLVGRYRVSMNTFISACSLRLTIDETWTFERAADGGLLVSRTDVDGAVLGVREPVQLAQLGKLARLNFSSAHEGTARNWFVAFEHVGAGGLGGGFTRTMTDGSCYANGTFAAARVPAASP
ncbi:hypothetical protein [Usitatibacter palustris]|uniref:Uncharacterized protein n=1 Tax=Usitatibacter palustris TaxID=2732487 RepID=A0A6M4HBM4_9PROT|nr:hypothetical protein [Usitatibacter palustris]QJR15367.1 hypothetical protein DSM104440_02186 [Usitatibacter palustris]